MKKIETIWHHVLYEALSKGNWRFTQQEIARSFGYSLSTVHHALTVPDQMGAIRKESKFFVLADFEKMLYYWASVRELRRDVLYQTRIDLPVRELEGQALPESIMAGYMAAMQVLKEAPADYDKFYFYVSADQLDKVKERYPAGEDLGKGEANVIALKMPEVMPRYGLYTTPVQTFVDLWNISDWYAREFTLSLKSYLDGLLS